MGAGHHGGHRDGRGSGGRVVPDRGMDRPQPGPLPGVAGQQRSGRTGGVVRRAQCLSPGLSALAGAAGQPRCFAARLAAARTGRRRAPAGAARLRLRAQPGSARAVRRDAGLRGANVARRRPAAGVAGANRVLHDPSPLRQRSAAPGRPRARDVRAAVGGAAGGTRRTAGADCAACLCAVHSGQYRRHGSDRFAAGTAGWDRPARDPADRYRVLLPQRRLAMPAG